MINEESGFKLLDFFGYSYKDVAVVLLLVELSEGREAVDRLLEGITALQVRRHVEHVAGQLREVLGITEEVST
jgi:hypothetical protein